MPVHNTATLTEIYQRHANANFHIASDKGVIHSYIEHYERLFKPFRDKPVDLLEIGIASGHSLLLWAEYFTAGMIYGVDIDPVPEIVKNHVRINCYQGNSTDIGLLRLLNDTKFDIIIDDGDHSLTSQLATLKNLWPLLKRSGIYIVEDVSSDRGLPDFKKFGSVEIFGSRIKNDRMVVIT